MRHQIEMYLQIAWSYRSWALSLRHSSFEPAGWVGRSVRT